LFLAAGVTFLYLAYFFVTRYSADSSWVPLHGQHPIEIVGHSLALRCGEVAGHLVDNGVLLPDARPLAASGLLMI